MYRATISSTILMMLPAAENLTLSVSNSLMARRSVLVALLSRSMTARLLGWAVVVYVSDSVEVKRTSR